LDNNETSSSCHHLLSIWFSMMSAVNRLISLKAEGRGYLTLLENSLIPAEITSAGLSHSTGVL